MGILKRIKSVRARKHPYCTLILAAAGSSARMGQDKLLMELCGEPVLLHTLRAVGAAMLVDEIIVATREDLLVPVAQLCKQADLRKSVKVIRGGDNRTESVLAAALEADPRSELLAVHDGARPLVRPEAVDELIRRGAATHATAPAVPVTDTIKIADESGRVTGTPDRSTLFSVQTPQVFQASILKAALQSALNDGASVTDDCAAVERLGKEIYLTPGDPENIKITVPLDLTIAEAILQRRAQE
ncbi:MAG: 2-C-methyl-D-erythritol 4-phosphate cytidylyltransferase [Oscillospiraceae bacterium]|nr:2-C-methyl-D-erythritol 4-phosphate cytidylyltransferase [Oscillospiraceae bacterium]